MRFSTRFTAATQRRRDFVVFGLRVSRALSGEIRAGKQRGQSLVEFALAGLLLGMLLAAALDLGRVFFTYQIVQQMAAEGATYAAFINPSACNGSAAEADNLNTIWGRAVWVAPTEGRVVHRDNVTNVRAAFSGHDSGSRVQVTVDYRLADLFLPNLLGMNEINLSSSAEATLTTSGQACAAGPTGASRSH